MNDVGFILVKLLNDESHDGILSAIKEIEKNNPYGQTVIFNSYCEKANLYHLPVLHLSQSQFFDGTLFLFDLPSVILTNKFPNLKKRIINQLHHLDED